MVFIKRVGGIYSVGREYLQRAVELCELCVCVLETRLLARSALGRIARVLCTQARRSRGGPPPLLFLPPCRNPGKMT